MSTPSEKNLLSHLFGYPLIKTNVGLLEAEIRRAGIQTEALADLVDRDTLVGMEVEVENVSQSAPNDVDPLFNLMWQVKEDGSLRNNGLEFVSFPLKGHCIPIAINKLHWLLTTFNKVDFSARTSVHFHINVRDLTVEQLFKVLLLYMVFEQNLYHYVFTATNVGRADNIFCVPIQQCIVGTAASGIISRFERGQQREALGSLLQHWKKYTGLNFLPVSSLGTIEFRQMSGTIRPTVLMEWVNILLCLKQFAKRSQSFADLKAEICALNTNSHYEHMLHNVFGDRHRLFPAHNLVQQMEAGVIAVKLAALPREVEQPDPKPDVFARSGLAKALGKHGMNFSVNITEARERAEAALGRLRELNVGFVAHLAKMTTNRTRKGNNSIEYTALHNERISHEDRPSTKARQARIAELIALERANREERTLLTADETRLNGEYTTWVLQLSELAKQIPNLSGHREFAHLSAHFVLIPGADRALILNDEQDDRVDDQQ